MMQEASRVQFPGRARLHLSLSAVDIRHTRMSFGRGSLDTLGDQLPFAHVADRDVELQIITYHLSFVSDLELPAAGQYDERNRVAFHSTFGNLLFAIGVRHRAGQLLTSHLDGEVDLQIVTVRAFHVPLPLTIQVGGGGDGQTQHHYDCAENESHSGKMGYLLH